MNISYGRLNFIKNLRFFDSTTVCDGSINLLVEYPVLYFNCEINSPDKKKLLKKFKINFEESSRPIYIRSNGYINILNNKVNFDIIEVDDHKALKDDLIFFKKSFEEILFDQDFLSIFETSKIRKFILEII